ncbi:MAG: PEP-CTERM sorting domain-containing protein [Planctomycetales bacterium]|nr:PEP-CTERM sorting domain-containing protein [Planctomycetales bacterium]
MFCNLKQLAGIAAVIALAFAPVAKGAGYVTLAPNSLDTVSLADLVLGNIDGVIVGDKIFDAFNYSATNNMPAADKVNVLGITDGDGNLGIRFQGAFQDLPDVGTQISSDAGITFEVTISPDYVNQGWIITDAHLFGSGVGTDGAGSFIAVDESFTGNDPVTVETMTVYDSRLNQGGIQLEDWAFFEPGYTKLRVQKDIIARASENAILPARMTIIDQTFSQTQVPEPAAFGLLGLGLCSMATRRRRGQ